MKLGRKLSMLMAALCLVMLFPSHANAQESEPLTIDSSNAQEARVINHGWVQSNGNWYFYQNNTKQIGWILDAGVWYYTNASGVMQTGWLHLHNNWYYLGSNGAMQTGWFQLHNNWYYLGNNGVMRTGWLNLNGTWYYLESNGVMRTGWLHLQGTWYYFKGNGMMHTGWLDLQNTWYYFQQNGFMVKNTTIDGWKVAANGVATPPKSTTFADYQKEVLALVNVERKNNGLKALAFNSELSKVATVKSQDMAELNYFAHESPTYGSPFDMMKAFGISYWWAGENLAMGYISPERVVEGWMNSPGHRSNILNSKFTELGVGVAKCDNGVLYWTQMFIGK